MQKNVAGQIWVVFAFQDEGGTNPGEPVTGNAANITANLYLDGSATPNAVDDVNPTELGGGYYAFSITAAESNAESIVIVPSSSTANVNVIGVPGACWPTPANFPDLSVTATTGRVDVGAISGTAQTANDVGADVDAILADTADIQPKIGTPVTNLAADIATIDTEVGQILADTADIQPKIGTPVTTLAADIATIDTEVGQILADTGTDGVKVDMAQAVPASPSAGTVGESLKRAAYVEGIVKNQAFNDFEFLMVDSTDHVSAKTGLTITMTVSLDGGAFQAKNASTIIAEVGNGIYQVDAAAADTNGDVVTWRFEGTGADDAFFTFKTVS